MSSTVTHPPSSISIEGQPRLRTSLTNDALPGALWLSHRGVSRPKKQMGLLLISSAGRAPLGRSRRGAPRCSPARRRRLAGSPAPRVSPGWRRAAPLAPAKHTRARSTTPVGATDTRVRSRAKVGRERDGERGRKGVSTCALQRGASLGERRHSSHSHRALTTCAIARTRSHGSSSDVAMRASQSAADSHPATASSDQSPPSAHEHSRLLALASCWWTSAQCVPSSSCQRLRHSSARRASGWARSTASACHAANPAGGSWGGGAGVQGLVDCRARRRAQRRATGQRGPPASRASAARRGRCGRCHTWRASPRCQPATPGPPAAH